MNRLRRILFFAAAVLLLAALAWQALGLIPPPLLVNRANGSYAVTDRDGRLLRLSLTGDEKYRLWTPLERISPALVAATLHYEDRQFYRHPGVNPAALARAAWTSFVSRDRRMGGSTLTMQLARQRWRLKTGTVAGKLRQIALAVWLERHFSKRDILEAYLNLAPYGANIEGAGAAAWVYFHKPAAELSADQARALALIPQHPNRRAPATPAGLTALRQAWKTAYGDDPGGGRLWFRRREDLPLRAPHFAERVRELDPERAEFAATLDPTAQGLAEDLLTGFIRRHRPQGIANAALMVVHAPTLEVLGYVGSADYRDPAIQGYVNGLKARRSPGSALKPFIYALAIDQGLITPDTLLKDTPLRIGPYQPENFESDFYGPLSATEALVRSRNIPAVALLARLQRPGFFQFLNQAGLRLPKPEPFYGLTLAMGGAEVSMEELLTLYGLVANGGEYRELHWLKDAEERAGKGRRLLSPEAAFLVRRMLETNPPPQRAFGARDYTGAAPVAWKTGTSSGQKDAWAVGLMGDLLAGVWVGNFDGTPNRHLVGRDLAGPLLFGLLEALRAERPVNGEPPAPPPGLKRVEICPLSGAPRSPACPHGKPGWIIPGVSPLKPCAVHRLIHVDPESGLRLCPGDERRGRPRVAEFWDSDVLEQFRAAGVRRETPPPFARACEGGGGEARPPVIVSPQAGVSYPVRADGQGSVEFSAVAPGGRGRLFWFVDEAFVGEGASILWRGRPGSFVVRVVDDQGQAAAVSLVAPPVE
jgi:penicillin-binding protein 1C